MIISPKLAKTVKVLKALGWLVLYMSLAIVLVGLIVILDGGME